MDICIDPLFFPQSMGRMSDEHHDQCQGLSFQSPQPGTMWFYKRYDRRYVEYLQADKKGCK